MQYNFDAYNSQVWTRTDNAMTHRKEGLKSNNSTQINKENKRLRNTNTNFILRKDKTNVIYIHKKYDNLPLKYILIYMFVIFPALFTASPDTGTFTTNSVIPFKYTMTIYGIKNQSSIENNGIFTVENGGIYLISCFINTDTVSTKFSIMRNSDRLAAATKHGDNYYESHAATIVAGLSAGDIVKVQANTNIFVDTGPDSMLTVVQII